MNFKLCTNACTFYSYIFSIIICYFVVCMLNFLRVWLIVEMYEITHVAHDVVDDNSDNNMHDI